MRYEDVRNKASELYKVMDALISQYYSQHREADALLLTNVKMSVQKFLDVPSMLIQEPPIPRPVAPAVEWVPEPAPLPNNGSKPTFHEVVSKPVKPPVTAAKRSHRRK